MKTKKEEKKDKDKGKDKDKDDESIAYAIGEISFIFLPFIVMIIIFSFKENLGNILNQPEWSLAASVMFGQSIIKLIYSIRKSRGVYFYRLGAVISLLVILGLVPSLTVLSLIFISTIVPLWLIVLQMILFIISAILFFGANAIQVNEDQ
jgi:hypothetical protein